MQRKHYSICDMLKTFARNWLMPKIH